MAATPISLRRACGLMHISTSVARYRARPDGNGELRRRIETLAAERRRFGYRRIHIMLRREGWPVNKKRVHRWYRIEGLQLRMRVRRRKHMCLHRGPVPQAQRTHERWSMDFVYDQLSDSRKRPVNPS